MNTATTTGSSIGAGLASGSGRAQRGLSLIEMMIAIALGAVLLLGLVEVFSTVKAAYVTANGLSRIQENSRFAMEFLRRDARMAGQWGCLNEYGRPGAYNLLSVDGMNPSAPFIFRADLPIEGFEYDDTAPGDEVELAGDLELSEAGSEWSPALPAELAAVLVGEAAKGSDVFVLRSASAESIPLGNPASIITWNPGGETVTIDPVDAGFIVNGGVYLIADCISYTIFQAGSAPNASGTFSVPDQSGQNLGEWTDIKAPAYKLQAPIYRYETAVYYVGEGVSGQPTLMRRRLVVVGAQTVLSDAEELVEGVESMQVSYALTNAADVEAATRADEYLSAEDVNSGSVTSDPARWQRVRAMRVGLLLRSPDRAVAMEAALPWVAGNVAFVLEENDERIRDTYDTIVSIRNR